ncbi:MAG: AAA family ATPase [Gemmatimonadetes bacterium]|nr:AAA family ATPase [Gemmatimonadota bacterium]
MHIRSLAIDAFGRLRDLDSGADPLGGLVVIQGRNEAGKTSLFEFLCTVLYGIYPTAADRHPFAPWDGTELGGVAQLRTRDGSEYEVTRRLRSTPVGTLRRNGRSDALRNDDLPFVDHVPRSVFRQVYAIRLAELASLDEDGWEAVQDRILGRLGAQDLRPTREVATELETAARGLWRPDRRGQPRIRQLDEDIRRISGHRPEARERAEQRRRDADRLAETRRVLESARNDRAAVKERLERLRLWVPVREELVAVSALEASVGDPAALVGMPPSPSTELARRRERVEAARTTLEELRTEAEELAFETEAVGEADRALLDASAEIDAFRVRVAAAEPLTVRLAAIGQERRALARRIDDAVERLPWVAEPAPRALMELALPRLEDALADWVEADRIGPSSDRDPPGADQATGDGSGARFGSEAGTVAVGAILLALGVAGIAGVEIPVAPSPSGALLLLLLGVLLVGMGIRRLRLARASAARQALGAEQRARAIREAREAVSTMLRPLGLSAGPRPDPELARRLGSCREWLRDDLDLADEAGPLESQLRALEDETARFAALLPERGEATATGLAAILNERLQGARTRATAADRAASRLERVEQLRLEAQERQTAAMAALRDLEARLAPFGDSADEAAEEAERSLAAAREAEQRRARLEARHADLQSIEQALAAAESEGVAWLSEPDPVGRLEAELEDRSDAIEVWLADERTLASRLEMPQEGETLDALEGQLVQLRADRERLRREHDRLWILSVLVDEADRRVRETHQPDILRLAGENLRLLTGGRYDRLEVSDDRSRELRVSGPALDGPREVAEPLSTGTREQVYLALRLALVAHLDEGGERLPLFFDEVFVNWDPERRERGLDLLVRTAGERQVFLFTCHPDWADRAVARGATRWRLDGP